MSVVFPRLVIARPQLDSAFLSRKLLPGGEATDVPRVAIATGFAAGGGLELQRVEGLTPETAKPLILVATANAGQGTRSWNVSEKSGFIFKKPSLLRAYGDPMVPVKEMTTDGGGIDDLSSDVLLDEKFMTEAAGLLRADGLIAAVPKRGWLMVGACMPGEIPTLIRFHKMATAIAENAGKDTITMACFFLSGGKLTGIGGGNYFSLVSEKANPWNLKT